MLPAGREKDVHICPAHQGGPVAGKAVGVEVNGQRAARGADPAACQGSTDFIVTGAATVTVNGKPAGRLTSKTAHGGLVALGSGNVLIGGPDAGVTLGNPALASAACKAAAAGRHPPPGAVYPEGEPGAGLQIPGGDTSQSYNNCGVEACRILINQATGSNYSEDEMLDRAIDGGNASGSKEPANRYKSGSTKDFKREDLLRQHGVESTQEPQDVDTLAQAVAEGRGVITSHDQRVLWNKPDEKAGSHAVLMTGVTYDENGRLVSVTTLDTGSGSCTQEVPVDRFKDSLHGWPNKANVTTKPVWKTT